MHHCAKEWKCRLAMTICFRSAARARGKSALDLGLGPSSRATACELTLPYITHGYAYDLDRWRGGSQPGRNTPDNSTGLGL